MQNPGKRHDPVNDSHHPAPPPCALRSATFIARTIERTRKLTGDEGQLWRLAKAQLLMSNANKEKGQCRSGGNSR